ncbi:MAG: EFR1 family ferrodoxin [Candidatus Hodarchaeales archaeon]|jgi:ferredoxin
MEIPIVYFSAAGGTEYICHLVKRGLERQGMSTELVPLKRAKKGSLNHEKFPILGIASPVYDFNFCKAVRYWMKNIPHSSNPKNVFLIDTTAGLPADSMRVAREIMHEKNYSSMGALEVVAPTTEPFFAQRWYPLGWKKANLDRAFLFGIKLGYNLRNNLDNYIDFTINHLGANFLSNLTLKAEKNRYWYDGYIKQRKEKCSKCRACEKACPMGAIDISKENAIDGHECMFCVSCVRVCSSRALYISYRPKAVPPKKAVAPKLIKGYVNPEEYEPPREFLFKKNYLANY